MTTLALLAVPEIPEEAINALTLLVSPFAPHLGEELWLRSGHDRSLAYAPWPVKPIPQVAPAPVTANWTDRPGVS